MTVRRFNCSSAARLASVLANDPATPYRAHRERVGSANFDRWAVDHGTRLLFNATGAFETGTGAIAWSSLPWDSEFFGFPAARIDLLAAQGGYSEAREAASKLLAVMLDDAPQVRHIIARVSASSHACAHALAANGFEWIDGIQTFALNVPSAVSEMPSGTRLATAGDADAIGAIARTSFLYDRFHNDISIGTDAANRLHEAWARNSLTGAADAVLIALTGDSIDSFVSVKVAADITRHLGISFASIPLVATAIEARGKGAAHRATAAAIAWCQQQAVDIVEVGTQLSNLPAARLYQSAGFRSTAVSLTYRKWVE